MRLVLASASPRRAVVLAGIGLDFDVIESDVDEKRLPDESPATYVERLARLKAMSVTGPDRLVVGADTVVVHEGRVLGKPTHPVEAMGMLQRLQGTTHEVMTGVAVASTGESVESMVDVAAVRMLVMTDEEIVDYVATGEPMDKAGGYALQGLAARFVESVSGSPYTVIGLPVHLLARLVARHGHDLSEFAAAR